ncbi:MAG: hypothetical protein P8P29_08860 [Flavobacteriaceae bacterium]|nr:hypothetical protein [Flavobacteriaceae bacterium]
MKNEIPNLDKIQTFVEAGRESLSEYTFVSEELNRKRGNQPKLMRSSEEQEGGDSEESVHYRMNQTGNIFYSTTSQSIQDKTKEMFDSVSVLFAAMTAAMAKNDKDLFDYDAWGKLIRGTGYFVEVSKLEKTLTIKNNSLSIDTQIIQDLIPGLKSGNSMEIAKGVLSSISGTYAAGGSHETSKFGHILFICEELFGAPSVTVRLFFGSKDSHTKVTSSPCHSTTSVTIEQKQEADTFLFVSPDTIAEFASTFGDHPQAYTDLIDKLSQFITE